MTCIAVQFGSAAPYQVSESTTVSAPAASPAQILPPELLRLQAQQSTATPYLLHQGDELDIRAFAMPDLNQTVRVRPDGRISLVLLPDVLAAGLTSQQLSEAIRAEYSKLFRDPKITVVVRSFSGFNVYVGGDVDRPGLVPLNGAMTAAAAIFQAGGFRNPEAPKTVYLLRQNAAGTSSVSSLNLDDVLTGKRPDTILESSDVLFVPHLAINVYVGGEVNEPGLIPLQGKMTLLAAVLRARGGKTSARMSSVVLLRDTGQGKPLMSLINVDQILANKAADVELKAYDVIYVPKSKIARADQFVDQYFKQLLPISVNGGFSYVLGSNRIF